MCSLHACAQTFEQITNSPPRGDRMKLFYQFKKNNKDIFYIREFQ